MAEEIWALKGNKYSIHQQHWPAYNPSLAVDEVITLVLQVNGKVRGRISMPVGLTEEDARIAALQNDSVRKHLQGHAPRKVIYVAGKLINIVV
jgi:leucyl-tRNA synthetase